MRKTVVIGLLGTILDRGPEKNRWNAWRPSVSICQHEDLLVHRFELLCPARFDRLAHTVAGDIATTSPETEVSLCRLEFKDPWEFEEVYGALHDFARGYPFDTEKEEYLVHITTGSHVAQICLFLLTESRLIPAKLIQTSPPKRQSQGSPGSYRIIDLDLSKYDRIAQRFREQARDDISFLKSGIETRNETFNALIKRIEQVAIFSPEPILLVGTTGAGKSELARRIYQLKKARNRLKGEFVEVNCATLRGEGAMSALFGHRKGAFTGAVQDRPGLLRTADGGMLFLDEVGELGLDEQAMLLRAVEEKRFLPVGADREAESSFQLICGTNKNLQDEVTRGTFREDLLSRINLWTFRLPGLADRPEDIEPNLRYELDRYEERAGIHVTFNKEARHRFLRFATGPDALWTANFRDLNGAVARMATLSAGGRITRQVVDEEIQRLRNSWLREGSGSHQPLLEQVLGKAGAESLDRFDRAQLADVLAVCGRCRTLSEAGRILFNVSREKKTKVNDADRLRKYLARFGLTWPDVSRRRMIQEGLSTDYADCTDLKK